MILIFTTSKDGAINSIIEKVVEKSCPLLRINENSEIDFDIKLGYFEKTRIKIAKNVYSIKDFNSIWFRHGGFFKVEQEMQQNKNPYVLEFLKNEKERFLDYLENNLTDKLVINRPSQRYYNKLQFLEVAKNHQLTTPISKVISDKETLKNFIYEIGELITKPISDVISQDSGLTMWTKRINSKDIEVLPERFAPSLFQQRIFSDFEIRGVYFMNSFYTCLHYPKTNGIEIDFRVGLSSNFGYERCEIPDSLKVALKNYFLAVSMDFCSFDILVSNDLYYVVDINPFGNFGMISGIFNEEIEMKIAEYLVKKNDCHKHEEQGCTIPNLSDSIKETNC